VSISTVKADITKLKLDAIVNAANTSLLGGGGVEGAVHRAAGKELEFACRMLNGCKVGEAKITSGFKLPAKYIIHTVAPVWCGGNANEDSLLRSCYLASLRLAADNGTRTVAFPVISTGIYGFPKDRAAQIAVTTVHSEFERYGLIEIIFCCFDDETVQHYQKATSA
jgi:O-acetyl-ADP-ribose deacetylase